MNEKPVKVDIDFNEALRRIAVTPKDAIVPPDKPKRVKEEKIAPPKKKKGRG
jgi:hypothetical protein